MASRIIAYMKWAHPNKSATTPALSPADGICLQGFQYAVTRETSMSDADWDRKVKECGGTMPDDTSDWGLDQWKEYAQLCDHLSQIPFYLFLLNGLIPFE